MMANSFTGDISGFFLSVKKNPVDKSSLENVLFFPFRNYNHLPPFVECPRTQETYSSQLVFVKWLGV